MRYLIVLLLCVLTAKAASSETVEKRYFKDWHYLYSINKNRGSISFCGAGIDYKNAWFLTRLWGENFDFLLYRDDFALPHDEVLGKLIFAIDGNHFLLTGTTSEKSPGELEETTGVIFMHPRADDIPDIYRSMKSGNEMQIVFPDGSRYPLSLRGSSAALLAASECWQKNYTGSGGLNPFKKSPKKNPFDA